MNPRLATCLTLLCCAAPSRAQFADPPWRFSVEHPAAGWERPSFDDSTWRTGPGGFGDSSTPGSRIGTAWSSSDIWLRRVVQLSPVPARAALYLHHDEDAEVFVNGVPVAAFENYITEYRVAPLDATARAALIDGDNLLAVHCRQTTGGQSIDVHLIDADAVPTLPAPPRPERPTDTDLLTEWGAGVTPPAS